MTRGVELLATSGGLLRCPTRIILVSQGNESGSEPILTYINRVLDNLSTMADLAKVPVDPPNEAITAVAQFARYSKDANWRALI